MDPYEFEPGRADSAGLEDEPLMTTSRHEILSYLGPYPGQDEEDGCF